ncbi:hypothetical protein EPr2_0067 [Providencia phage EPr2]|uniref:Uncharacterized protein n=2 Tax=Providencia phage EPr2 TaxID=2917333 RepID=A0AC61TT48_9CAUD|nr:hypothetical protein EPr2_0004 [Providencia phage EPr2]UNI71175.1 hypothetical protein EPr2_0067 [Providencia phage EPr2]
MDQKFETTSHSSRTSSLPIGPLSVQTKGPTPVYHKVGPMVKTSGQR